MFGMLEALDSTLSTTGNVHRKRKQRKIRKRGRRMEGMGETRGRFIISIPTMNRTGLLTC